MMMSMSLFTSAWNWYCSPAPFSTEASSDLRPTVTPDQRLSGASSGALAVAAATAQTQVTRRRSILHDTSARIPNLYVILW